MINNKGFIGVFGDLDKITSHSSGIVSDFTKCDNLLYSPDIPSDNISVNDDLVIIFLGRLDNTLDLSGKLNLPQDSKDIDFVSQAFLLYGEKCPENLIGDFSFIVFDRKNKKLLLAKDQIGIKPLFYLQKDGCLFFASSIGDLVSLLKEKEQLNKEYIAKELLSYQQQVEDTFYENILRLKPAHILVFFDDKIQLKRYWDLSPIDLSHLKSDKEVYDLLSKTLEESILCRIRKANNVGCQLSGGIDSSAIAVLLSRFMNKKNLHTYSFVLNDKTSAYTESGIDEKGTQKIIIDYAGLISENHHQVEEFHFKNVFEEFESTQGLYAGAANSNGIWQESMFKQAAKKDHIDVMFSGFPGDEGISNSGGLYYYDFIGNLDMKSLAGSFSAAPLRTIKKIILYFRAYLRGSYVKGFSTVLKTRSLLNPKSQYNSAFQHSSFSFSPSFKKYLKKLMLRSHTCLRTESEGLYAGKYGIETVYPLADIRLLQLVYSLPTRFFEPKAYNRALFRDLCKGILPDEVRLQPKFSGAKTLAFADYWWLSKYEELKDYVIEDRLGMFIDVDSFKKKVTEGEFMMKKGVVKLKELDYLINRNWPEDKK